MPENLPTPKKSLKQLEKERNKQIKSENKSQNIPNHGITVIFKN